MSSALWYVCVDTMWVHHMNKKSSHVKKENFMIYNITYHRSKSLKCYFMILSDIGPTSAIRKILRITYNCFWELNCHNIITFDIHSYLMYIFIHGSHISHKFFVFECKIHVFFSALYFHQHKGWMRCNIKEYLVRCSVHLLLIFKLYYIPILLYI